MSKPVVRTTTSAKVTVTLELSSLGSWGPGCKIEQVYEQAREAAIGRLNKVFKDHISTTSITQIKVEAITTDVEQRR